MPVYTEVATSQRDLRVQPTYAQPLPRLAPDQADQAETNEYDVIVVGSRERPRQGGVILCLGFCGRGLNQKQAGPTGLLATLLLSRYGIPDGRLLCIDSKASTLRSGQADGLQPRTLEVIESLGLHHEIIDQGCQFWEISFWNSEDDGCIRRTRYGADVDVPSQYPHESTIHQGRIERIFDDDLKRYSPRGVERSTTLMSVTFDDGTSAEYPVEIEVEKSEDFVSHQSLHPGRHRLRCKHLIGADGAHSAVRKAAGIPLVGESREFIWGVMDFVADTRFPDIRRKSMVQSKGGSCMIIPREGIATGEYLTRLYVHMDETESGEMQVDKASAEEAKLISKEKRKKVSVDRILGRANQALHPYRIKLKDGTQPDWWAAYEIGQRACEDFVKRDSQGVPRIFLAGDACHTHSPKAGQGMNVSMMDSYNLTWKLAHYLLHITPERHAIEILNSYEAERRQVARDLIDFDRALSTAFSKKDQKSVAEAADIDDEERLDEIWRLGQGFSSGCGIEYGESGLVSKDVGDSVEGDDYLRGTLRPGRRLLNVRVQRHTDGRPTAMHEQLLSHGRFNVMVMASTDLLEADGRSAAGIASAASLVERYGESLVGLTVVHALTEDIRGIDWDRLPPGVFERAEMAFFSANPGQAPRDKQDVRWGTHRQVEDAFSIYGVSKDAGAIVVLRPDQVVGMVAGLTEGARVHEYLDRWLTACA